MNVDTEKSTPLSRRTFFISTLVTIGGILLSGLVTLRNGLLFLFPKPPETEFSKFLVAKVDDIPLGQAKEIRIANTPVFVIHLPEGFQIFSGVCPHHQRDSVDVLFSSLTGIGPRERPTNQYAHACRSISHDGLRTGAGFLAFY
jgi:hypothetical protein